MDDVTADPANTSDFSRWRRTSPFAIVFFIRGTIENIRLYGQLLATFGLAFLIVRARDLAGDLIPVAVLLIIVVAVPVLVLPLRETGTIYPTGSSGRLLLTWPLDRVQRQHPALAASRWLFVTFRWALRSGASRP